MSDTTILWIGLGAYWVIGILLSLEVEDFGEIGRALFVGLFWFPLMVMWFKEDRIAERRRKEEQR